MVSLKVLETKVTIPSSGVKIEVPNTKAVIADQDFGSGILCVAERWENNSFSFFEINHQCYLYSKVSKY